MLSKLFDISEVVHLGLFITNKYFSTSNLVKKKCILTHFDSYFLVLEVFLRSKSIQEYLYGKVVGVLNSLFLFKDV